MTTRPSLHRVSWLLFQCVSSRSSSFFSVRGQLETAKLQPFVKEKESVSFPYEPLDAVTASSAKQEEDILFIGLQLEVEFHNGCQPIDPAPQICITGSNVNLPEAGCVIQHEESLLPGRVNSDEAEFEISRTRFPSGSPDPDGKRIGSGGATLHVLRTLSEREGFLGDFHGKRILVIHSGGDSKRVPQYSVCGKLFSPVPRELPDGRGSTLFDEFLIGMSGVPSRFKEGMLVLSGDVLLLFNPLQIDAQFSGAAAISMKSPAEIGKDHGVFLNDGTDHVKKIFYINNLSIHF